MSKLATNFFHFRHDGEKVDGENGKIDGVFSPFSSCNSEIQETNITWKMAMIILILVDHFLVGI
ncbi:MAG: hypothetical protein GY820_42140 [Gammaproteobacteria bacterium]|nr:hypothetical protein [Gammaproteobacteria bacterium]